MKITRNLVAAVAAAVALLATISCTAKDKKLTFNGGDLLYTSQVTEADAKKLGNFLVEDKFFDGTEKTVKLNKSDGTYEFRMVLKERTTKKYSGVAKKLSEQVFNGQKVVVHLCDAEFKTLQSTSSN